MSFSLDKTDWFVDPTTSTDYNLVQPLIDGVATFVEIDVQFAGLSSGDFCFYAAWEITPTFHLTVNGTHDISTRFIDASNAGAKVRVLLFQNWSTVWDGHQALRQAFQAATTPPEILLDTKHQSFGSHHQKFCIFGKKNPASSTYRLTAFCGGIDPAKDRFDDQQHRPTDSIDNHLGWHDVHSQIEGPAAEQLLQTFIERWNDHAHPLEATKYHSVTTAIDPITVELPVLQQNSQQVEVLHTYSCLPSNITGHVHPVEEWGYSFAGAGGIQTIKQAYLKAIARAEKYIYIENQYFAEMEIIWALRERLSHGVTVIAVTPYFMNQGYDLLRLDAWKLLKSFSNFYLCDIRHPDAGYCSDVNSIPYPDSNYCEPIYVHVKLMIVDDIYSLIGSANLNARSMELDSELAIGILDSQSEIDDVLQLPICAFARNLRIALFEEHLQVSWQPSPANRSIDFGLSTFISSINDPVGGISLSPSRIFRHDPEKVWYTSAKRLMVGTTEKVPECRF